MTSGAASSPLLKFIASGVFNTLATYLVYLVLLRVLPYWWSYTIAYLSGIALAYVLYRYVVFRRTGGRSGPLWVVLIYLLQYFLGLGLVSFWIRILQAPEFWAPAFAVAVATPLSYGLNRWVFRDRQEKSDTGSAVT